MGLTDLNFSSLIPGATGFGLNADPIGVGDWLDTPDTADIAAFSSKIDGQDWYKIFPYQFVIVDTSDIQDSKTFTDLNPEPVKPKSVIAAEGAAGALAAAQSGDLGDIGNIGDLATASFNADVASASDLQTYTTQMAQWNAAKAAATQEGDQEEDANAKKIIYTLPIPPDALAVQPMFAQEATASLTGVVEETSKNVFWMINLSGTTGIAIGRASTSGAASVFRDRLSTTGLLSGLGSSLSKLASTVTSVAGALDDVSSADSFSAGASAVADLAQAALLPKLPYFQSAVPDGNNDDSNGYLEMHLLHRFLVAYGDIKEKHPFGSKLYFINHKDGQQWRVVIKQFRIQKSMNEPHLYRYQIVLKGWELKNPGETKGGAIDRFKTDLAPVNTTTLTNLVGSLNSLVTNSIGNPNNIIPVVL